jgi:hypothetical protein
MYTIYKQSNTFTYIRQLVCYFGVINYGKRGFDFLGGTMTGKFSVNLIPPVMLRNILKYMTSYFPDGYALCDSLQQKYINLFYEFMDISVLADCYSVKMVMLIPLKTFERHFYFNELITFRYKISN